MSYPVNLQALPREVLEEVFSPGNMRGRNSVNSFTQLSFPKSRSALWDGSPAGDKLRLQLCCHRKPRVVLLEKALRLALRHARHSNRPRLQCFFLGSVSVDPDEEGITVNLDRWLSGVTHVYNPQVWARCVRFMFSSALQDRVLSESGCFLLVVFGSTHRTPQFFQCRGPGPEPQLDFQLLTASQSASLYQAAPVPGRVLQCELGLEDLSRQAEVFRASQKSFSSSPPPAVRLSDHDSGVEDEDFSPRPSPRPHPPAPQARRVQPSVPELSLLVDSSSSNHDQAQPSGSAPRLSPANRDHAPPLPLSWCCDSSSSHPSRLAAADSVTSPWLLHPLPVNRCCDKMGGVAPSDTYQLLLHQDRQLRLLQAQIQMLLEAQGKIPVDTQTSTSTASIAVETGASLFWGGNPEHRDELPGPGPSSKLPPSSSSSLSSSSHDLSVRSPAGGPEEEKVRSTEVSCSASDHHSISSPQSPVLGESVSMYGPPEEQQSFYQNLMTRLNSRLQESHHNQEAEDESRRSSVSASQSSQNKPLQQKKSANADPVVRATLRQLQQLGVDVDQKDLMESNLTRAVENASTLASINPAAVVSRLGVSDLTSGALLPGGSVDLSLEANAIALRYLTDSQLNKLSLGGHAPQHVTSSTDSLLSPSNMSLATRKYMRRYGLIEEEEEEQEEEVRGQEARQPLSDALNVRLLPQSQLIRDLRPKMQLLTGGTKPDSGDKENRSGRRNSLVRAGSREPEGSLGNILDLSRLRQLPKLF
uniref:TAL1 (SCL) interrupting locus n=1 Tax=Nothobranchius pienaari TaxID=704102 RepID=A0A1A8MQZ2_9TELE